MTQRLFSQAPLPMDYGPSTMDSFPTIQELWTIDHGLWAFLPTIHELWTIDHGLWAFLPTIHELWTIDYGLSTPFP